MDRKIGLLGGGQLGQMLCEAANPLGIEIVILDAENSPAKQVNAKVPHLTGSFTSPSSIRELAKQVDLITVEIEHVDTEVLEEIAERGVEMPDGTRKIVEVQPSWKTLRVIQDKYKQKEHLIENGVETAESRAVEVADLKAVGKEFGYPFMLKARRDAYDGRGNFPVFTEQDIEEAVNALKGRSLYAEKWANFRMELAVMVIKTGNDVSTDGQSTLAYPVVETIHEDSICKLVYCPPRGVPLEVQKRAQDLARKAVGCLWGKGVFGVELFLMDSGKLVVNEIAPRPHNSGHYTIEACPTLSQYKAQLLSILDLMPDLPTPTIPSLFPAAIMLNIIGGAFPLSHQALLTHTMRLSSANLHMYGKASKPARKIGHITVISSKSMADAETQIFPLIALTNQMRAERKEIEFEPVPAPPIPGPLVAITMGSDSDLPVLKPGLALLKSLAIPFYVTITSAHRTPDLMCDFAASAADKGFKVIIAAAGGAAHLPGMIASHTSLPVIGVPVKGSTLDGMDSLLSIVQMPRGVPVATVSINNSINAALLAARILGTSDPVIFEAMERYRKDIGEEVGVKRARLEEVGFEKY